MEQCLLQVLLLLGVLSSSLSFRGQYILIQQSKTWVEAQAFCRANHLDLATLNNDNDREDFKKDLAASNFQSDVWVGLYVNTHSWRWSFQDEGTTYDKWNSGEPNNYHGNEECGCLISFKGWNDAHCSLPLYCLCYDEKKNSSILVKDQFRTWHDAQSYCRQHYTDLATVRNSDDQDNLQRLMLNNTGISAWIGLFRDSWNWSDGANITSILWNTGQPDNHLEKEACGYANSVGSTGDRVCMDLLPFVCNTVVKKIIVRVELNSLSNVSNSQTEANILQQIQQKLKQRGMAADAEVTWKVQADGQVFHVKENYT